MARYDAICLWFRLFSRQNWIETGLCLANGPNLPESHLEDNKQSIEWDVREL